MMRHESKRRALIGLALGFLPLLQAAATPVYLHVDSRFPSGHHTRQVLENRTKRTAIQRWLHVETKDKVIGWMPEDHCLTAIRLVNEAAMLETVPVRTDMSMDSVRSETIAKGLRVAVDEVQGSWVKIRFNAKNGEVHESYVPTEALVARIPQASATLAGQRVYLPSETSVLVLPGPHARAGGKLRAGSIAEIVREQAGFLEVRYSEGTGYLNRKDVITASDLGLKGARPLLDLAPLRSAPLPYADLLRSLATSTTLKITGAETLRWGLAKVPDIGEVWWPIAEGEDDRESASSERITSGDLFKRKIFDMASSPAIPSLKFVSAQGVFRTVDGKEWTRLPTFQDKNYPIAIAGLGSVFVGPYVSDDHGETFQQWIRWDSLVAVLRRHARLTPQRLQIQEIRPEDPAGRRVVLKLSVGTGALVKLVTEDQGLSWRPLVR